MPGPDPHALWIEDDGEDPSVCWQRYFWTGNEGNRKARAIDLVRRLAHGNWFCRWCGDPLPDYLRTDARYCREACRKRAARVRHHAR